MAKIGNNVIRKPIELSFKKGHFLRRRFLFLILFSLQNDTKMGKDGFCKFVIVVPDKLANILQ